MIRNKFLKGKGDYYKLTHGLRKEARNIIIIEERAQAYAHVNGGDR